ncbi:MAG: sensor histidine kinase, partial [Acidimicrobiales bacterium]|nr:sensor histidine kinase [Acidimicrobiales bacterium]
LLARSAADAMAVDRLLAALAALPQGIVVADHLGQVVVRNPAASAFVEARHGDALVESAIGELIEASLSGEGTTRTLELFGPPRRVLDLRVVPLLRRPPRGSAGSTRPVVLGAMAVIDDVSERQRLDAVRRDFVANISHELKTPIGALGVLSETLVGETDPATVERLAERIQTEAFRLARTVDDLLQLSRIEASEPPDAESVSIRQVVAEAVERTEAAADLQKVRISVTPVEGWLTVVGDRRQLVSALANLLENAVKYSDAGAEVTVSARAAGDGVELDVADHGIGIPATDLERVFERFYRVDRARSRDTGGTGLGLAIVRHVAQNHGGDVVVRSREGEGSTFTLRLAGVAAVPPVTEHPPIPAST